MVVINWVVWLHRFNICILRGTNYTRMKIQIFKIWSASSNFFVFNGEISFFSLSLAILLNCKFWIRPDNAMADHQVHKDINRHLSACPGFRNAITHHRSSVFEIQTQFISSLKLVHRILANIKAEICSGQYFLCASMLEIYISICVFIYEAIVHCGNNIWLHYHFNGLRCILSIW